MKYYKGFDKDLKCRGFQYEVGKTYTEEKDPILCMKGFHCCKKLSDVFKYYTNKKGLFNEDKSLNRYCVVELGGKVIHDGDKSASNQITIIEELNEQGIEFYLKQEKDNEMDEIFCIDIVKKLQDKYNIIIGGSVSLYLYGLEIDRKEGKIDFDIIMPYYQKMEEFEDLEIEEFDGKSSGNDFSSTFGISEKGTNRFIKADIRIKPDQKYDVVEYKGNKYKVCDIMATLEAKCRYAIEGNKKHRNDVLNLLKKNDLRKTN